MAKRVQLARALDRVGLLALVLKARARWPRHTNKALTVLTFHRVAASGAPGFDPEVSDTTPEAFDRQVAMLARYFNLVDTAALDAHRMGAPLPPNPALITFDDGYRDNHDQALPILRRHGARAVFFVATRYLDERRLFWWERINRAVGTSPRDRVMLGYPEERRLSLATTADRRAAARLLLSIVKKQSALDLERFLTELEAAAGRPLPRHEERELAEALLLSWDHVRALKAAGMDVQSHTHAHRVLQTLTDEEVTEDLRTSRSILEGQIEAPVYALAYPAGKSIALQPGLRRAVRRSGIRVGLTTEAGRARLHRSLDWLGIPRVTVERDMPEPFFRGCLAFPQLAY